MPKRKKPKTKKCSKCWKRKSVAEFDRDRKKRDGRRTTCKACQRDRHATYREQAHEADPVGFSLKRLYYQCRARAGRKDRDCTITASFLQDLYDEQGGRCSVTGELMTTIIGCGKCGTNISVDRIDNTIGYVQGNVRLVCFMVNNIRSDMSDIEMMWWCQKIVDNCTADMDTVTEHAAPIEPIGDIDIHSDD